MAKMSLTLLALSTSFFISTASHADLFSLRSASFEDRKNIPAAYTCDGGDRSPQLAWRGVPAKTQSFVLLCADPDAPTGVWFHWVVYNIPSQVSALSAGVDAPQGASLGRNSWGRMQYSGPCPPARTIHRYIFTLYALDTQLNLPQGESAARVLQAAEGHVLGKATILGVFGH